MEIGSCHPSGDQDFVVVCAVGKSVYPKYNTGLILIT